jgi:hypothetical protein
MRLMAWWPAATNPYCGLIILWRSQALLTALLNHRKFVIPTKFRPRDLPKELQKAPNTCHLYTVSVPESDSQQLKKHGRTIRTRTDHGGNPRLYPPHHLGR